MEKDDGWTWLAVGVTVRSDSRRTVVDVQVDLLFDDAQGFPLATTIFAILAHAGA
ncbi:MAG: hypothetical protein O3B65_02835 [Chloroflexi bacterium]|nr:hypothetical protein [Chloroflexota bacterium]